MQLLRRRDDAKLARRRTYIEGYAFPLALRDEIRDIRRPPLNDHESSLVLQALRQFFLAFLYSGGKVVGMPSRAADHAWHEFILMTRAYEAFCEEAFGRFLHHTPQSASDQPLAPAIVRTFNLLERHVTAPGAIKLPLLFTIDTQLNIDDRRHWTRKNIDALKRRNGDGGGGGGGCGGSGDGGSCGGGGCGGG